MGSDLGVFSTAAMTMQISRDSPVTDSIAYDDERTRKLTSMLVVVAAQVEMKLIFSGRVAAEISLIAKL